MASIQELALNRGNRGLLLLAVLAGLVAAALVFVVLANSDSGGKSTVPAVATKAVVAKQEIAAGTKVTADMVEVVDVPQNLLIAGAVTDTNAVVGQAVRYPVRKGEQLALSKVGAEAKGDGLQFVVPAGKRAVGLKVQQATAVGGNLLVGDHVDVLASFGGKKTTLLDLLTAFGNGDKTPTVVLTVLQNVEVLAVAQEAQQPVPAASGDTTSDLNTSGQLPDKLKEQPNATTVTLAVTPEQAQMLVAIQEAADNVYMSLRPFGEEPTAQLPKFDINALVNQ